MCGIAGIFKVWTSAERERALCTPHGESIPETWLDILDDSIKHRGPDGQGRFRDRVVRADGSVVDVALVHRRLSIIDHAGGHQPMVWQGGPGMGTSALRAGRLLSAAELESHNERIESGSIAEGSSFDSTNPEEPGSESRGTQNQELIAVVFNGCIYNHRKLRAELQNAGHVFSTDHSDTEVLVHGWREWGTDLPSKLEGMFALAIWNRSTHSLFLARDHFGEKPLNILSGAVWKMDPESTDGQLEQCDDNPFVRQLISKPIVAFSSVPAGLERLQILASIVDRVPRKDPAEFDGTRLASLLAEGYPSFHSAAPPANGHELQASHWEIMGRDRVNDDGWLVVSDGAPNQGEFAPGTITPGGPEYRRFGGRTPPARGNLTPDRVDRLLRAAVSRRVEADVPMGAFLSGGVDSSLICAYARESVGKLRTFSMRMPDARFDESEQAAEVAKIIGTVHTTLDCQADPAADLQRLITQLGVPFGDSSLLPTYWISRAAREHVSVVLTGDGGDELFAGYERHMAHFTLRRWRPLLAILPSGALSDRDPRSKWSRAKRLIEVARTGESADLANIFAPKDIDRLFAETRMRVPRMEGLAGMLVVESLVNKVLPRRHPWSFGFQLSMGLDYLTGDLLRKVDTATMAVALESRAPFLDSDLAAAVHDANPLDLIAGGQRKGLLRQVARKYFPAEIVDRPKMGFAIPIGEWFRSDYGGMRTMLLDHLNSTEPFGPPSLGIDLNLKFIRQMLDEHLGTGPSGIVKRDHSQRLYMLLALSIWAKWMGSLR